MHKGPLGGQSLEGCYCWSDNFTPFPFSPVRNHEEGCVRNLPPCPHSLSTTFTFAPLSRDPAPVESAGTETQHTTTRTTMLCVRGILQIPQPLPQNNLPQILPQIPNIHRCPSPHLRRPRRAQLPDPDQHPSINHTPSDPSTTSTARARRCS